MPKKRAGTKSKTLNTTDQPRKKINLKKSVSFHESEDVKHSSSSCSDRAIILKPEQFKQKLMIAANILVECREEKKVLASGKYPDTKIESIVKRLKDYTNLSTDELTQVNDSVRTRDRLFTKAFKDIKTIPNPTLGFLADDIRRIFFKFIVAEQCFPAKVDLLKELKILSNKYTAETMTIARLVKNNLIKYHYFPEFKRCLISEHPERVYERTLYLKNILELRSQKRKFVYVEVRRIIPRSTTSGFIAGLAAFPSSGKMQQFFTKDIDDLIAKKWLQQRILPLIQEDNVVVFSQPKKDKKLSEQSKKADFVAWLDEHEIPYEKSFHTAELYSLYNNFKGKVTCEGIYDHVFINEGIELIHSPVEWRKLNFFKQVWAELDIMDTYHTGRPEVLKQSILNATQTINTGQYEETLIGEEVKMRTEDSAMEDVMEKVLQIVKEKEVQATDFPVGCYAGKADFFETHVGDVIYN